MSRVEENEKFVANVPESFSGSSDQVMMKEYAAILGTLVDISKSLAIIADCAIKLDYEEDDRTAENYEQVLNVFKGER